MDVTSLLEGLNDAQREAVAAGPGPLLVLAGAGSGKTRVLTHRVAWLVGVEGVSPHAILAVTFTNKAAAEMRSRIERMLGNPVAGLWIGTFHGLSHRLLRAHWQDAGLPQGFQILDAEDQLRLVKRVLRNLGLDEAYWPPRQAMAFINGHKEEGRRVRDLGEARDPTARELTRIYRAYEESCERSGLVDFAELLLRAYELLRDNAAIRAHYQNRFRHVLVDEFQDTNSIQYAWLEIFAAGHKNLFVVGDDDQSIYGWRGARVENILRFEKDHPGTRAVRLEQNYRSTSNILRAANSVIRHNHGRLGKELWTAGAEGEPVYLYTAYNDLDEARFVVERIEDWVAQGHRRAEAAVLYRSNAQSRAFEHALVQAGVPYRVYGGLRFFERQEIKDALAYLRLIASRQEAATAPDLMAGRTSAASRDTGSARGPRLYPVADDGSFERVANVPVRGLGDKTLEAVRAIAKAESLSLWEAARQALAREALPARGAQALGGFLCLIDELAQETAALALGEQVEHVIARTGLIEHCRKEKGEKGESRVENLEELVTAARGFEFDEAESAPSLALGPRLDSGTESRAMPQGRGGYGFDPIGESEGLDPLSAFLAHAALEAGEAEADPWEDCVQLMSLHSAKGLEFPLVFLTGLEEGLFPHQRSLEEPGRLEEERRLCYVGMTRARERLVLSHAEVRHWQGRAHYASPSRFLDEIEPALIESIRTRPGASVRAGLPAAAPPPAGGLRLGSRVRHATFGDGVVVRYEGHGSQARVQVQFETAGSKWLVLAYARLETLGA
jgi:DNA helicase-2/ATP-dependent DNA helicase PcrA